MSQSGHRGLVLALGALAAVLVVNGVLTYWNTRNLNGDAGWVALGMLGLFGGVLWRSLRADARAAAKLHEQREWLRTTLASIGDGVIATDAEGRVKLLNSVAESLTGWTLAEAMGRPLRDVFNIVNEETLEPADDPVAKVLQSGQIVGLANHTALVSKDGTQRIIADSAAPIRDASGNVTGVVLVFRDATEARRMERAIAEKASFPHLNPYPVVEADEAGELRYINPAAERLFPDLRQAGRSHPWLKDWDAVVRLFREENVTSTVREVAIGKQWYQQSMYYVPETGRIRTYGVEVSERKQAEEELRQSERRVRLKLESILSPAGNIGKLELADVLDAPAVQTLMDDFYELARIPMAVIDLEGRVLVGVGWQEVCTRFHRVHPDTRRHCIESDTELSAGIPPGESRLYKCKNHMWDIATPIMIGGQHVGNVFAGQFFFEGETPDRELFRKQARDYGFDEKAYLGALDAVPRLSRETVDVGMAFFRKLADIISQLSFSNIKLARALAEGEALTKSLRKSQETLRQLNRTLRAHSRSDQGLLRAVDEKSYLAEVCKIIVEDCGHAMVWIGIAEDDEAKSVRPVACAGFEQGYLDTLKITWSDTERGRGPTGTAIRTGKPYICRDMVNDPAFAPWRSEAIKRGYASSVALPLMADGQAFGAMMIYSQEPDPFSAEEIELLSKLADDFSYGIESLRLRAAHALAEEALRQSEHDLERAQTVAHVGSWRLNVRKDELLWSDEAYRIFEIPLGTPLTYQSFLAAVHPEDRQVVDEKWSAALGGERYDIEHRILVGGRVKWLREQAELEVDDQGSLLGGFGTVQDITDRRQAEQAIKEREEELAAIYENAPLIMLLVDGERRLRKANKYAEQFAAEPLADLLQRRGGEALHCINALQSPLGCGSGPHCQDCLVRRTIQETLETGRSRTQVEASLPLMVDGRAQKLTFLMSTTRVSVRREPLVLVTIQDITERKEAEESLRWTADELARSNEDLSQFAYVASHDLQEPLRMVSGFMQLLQKKYGGHLDEEADQFIEYAVDGAKRMQTLINDLLAYSRLGTRGHNPASTDAREALERALGNLRAGIDEATAEITYGALPMVHADTTHLTQLFQNLIGNALKFRAAAAPKIHIDAQLVEDRWQFSVRDNGIGISPEFQDRIFLIFQRLHTRQQYPGTGIGLAICKKIIDRHGGRIWIESDVGQGATFYFTLPGEA